MRRIWLSYNHVPDDQPTIQAGIDVAIEADTVLVVPGTYTGDGNRDLDSYAKHCRAVRRINDLIILAGYYYGYGPAPCCAPPLKRPDLPGRDKNDGPPTD